MTNGKTLATSAVRPLRPFSPDDAPEVDASMRFRIGDGLPAEILPKANDWTWTALEIMLASDRLRDAPQADSSFAHCLREAIDALETRIAPEAFHRADPEWKQTCRDQLRAARQAALPSFDSMLDERDVECAVRENLIPALERSAWYCLRPLLEMRIGSGELLCVALLEWFARKTLGLSEAGEQSEWDGALNLVVKLLENHSSPLEGALRDACGVSSIVAGSAPIDAMAASLRFQRGLGCIQNGEYERAIIEFNAAIQHNSSMEHAYAQRGDAQRMLGAYDRSLVDYTSALRINPANVSVLINRGQTSRMLGKLQSAVADYDAVLQLDPNNVVALNHRGTVRAELGDHDEAVVDFTEALNVDPDYPFSYQNRARSYAARGDLDRAIADYGRVLQLNPMFTLAHLRRADVYRQKGELTQAIADYTEALRLDPMLLHAYVNRGVAYQEQGEPNRALSDFASALKLDASNPRMFLSRGIAYRDCGDLGKALSDFDAALRLDPDNDQIYFHRALARQELGDSERALADLDEAIRRKPDVADAYFHRGTLRVMRREPEPAVVDLSEAIRLEPSNPRAYLSRAQAYSLYEDLERVIDDCSAAIDLDASLLRARMMRGTARYRQGNHAEALADFETILKANPTDAEAMVNRGVVHARMGRHDAAINGLTRALQIAPDNAKALAARANSYRAQDRHEAALADYAQAFRDDPRYSVAFCNQRGLLNLKLGHRNLALADCALSLLIEPDNRRALQLREQILNSTDFEVDSFPTEPAAIRMETEAKPLPPVVKRRPRPAPIVEETQLSTAAVTESEVVLQASDLVEEAEETQAVVPPPERRRASPTMSAVPVGVSSEAASTDPEIIFNDSATHSAELNLSAHTEAESPADGENAADYEQEQKLLQERLEAEKAAQRALAEQHRKNEEARLAKQREERDAKLRSLKKVKRERDPDETSPWIRRGVGAVAAVMLLYLIGPPIWAYATKRSYPQEDKEKLVAEAKVSASELCKRFQDDAGSAQAEYGQKVLEVHGTVKDVQPEGKDHVVIVLMNDRKEGRVMCKMPNPKTVNQGTLLSSVDRNGTVTLTGKCTGQDGNKINLDGVQLVQVRSN